MLYGRLYTIRYEKNFFTHSLFYPVFESKFNFVPRIVEVYKDFRKRVSES